MHLNGTVCNALKSSVVLVAIFGGLFLGGCNSQQQPPPPSVPEVAITTVQPQKIMLVTELPGRTSAFLVAEIRPQVSGIIKKRLFMEGSEVKAGQVLYQIDSAPFQAAFDNAKASLARAEANLPATRLRVERFQAVLPDKAISQQDYDDAAAALKQVEADIQFWKAAVKTARISLDYCGVIAPISGRIGKSQVTEGAIVTAYQPVALATIQQLDPVYVDVPQSTTELLRLKRRLDDGRLKYGGTDQNKVKLILEDGSAYPLEGTLQFQDVSVDPTTGSVILRVVFPNPEGLLLPGMFVRAVIKEGVNPQAILVLQPGVFRDPKGNPLALIVDGEDKLQPRMLTLDRAIGDKWLVSGGLSPGDRLIVEGLQRVQRMPPGTPVKAVPFEGGGTETRIPEKKAGSADRTNGGQ